MPLCYLQAYVTLGISSMSVVQKAQSYCWHILKVIHQCLDWLTSVLLRPCGQWVLAPTGAVWWWHPGLAVSLASMWRLWRRILIGIFLVNLIFQIYLRLALCCFWDKIDDYLGKNVRLWYSYQYQSTFSISSKFGVICLRMVLSLQ